MSKLSRQKLLLNSTNMLFDSNGRSRISLQLHTYVFLVPTSKTEPPGFRHRFYNNARFSKVRWMFGSNDYINSELPRNPEHDENNLDSKPSEYESILKSLSYGEKQSVLGVPAASDPEDLKIFSRYLQSCCTIVRVQVQATQWMFCLIAMKHKHFNFISFLRSSRAWWSRHSSSTHWSRARADNIAILPALYIYY